MPTSADRYDIICRSMLWAIVSRGRQTRDQPGDRQLGTVVRGGAWSDQPRARAGELRGSSEDGRSSRPGKLSLDRDEGQLHQ